MLLGAAQSAGAAAPSSRRGAPGAPGPPCLPRAANFKGSSGHCNRRPLRGPPVASAAPGAGLRGPLRWLSVAFSAPPPPSLPRGGSLGCGSPPRGPLCLVLPVCLVSRAGARPAGGAFVRRAGCSAAAAAGAGTIKPVLFVRCCVWFGLGFCASLARSLSRCYQGEWVSITQDHNI